MLLEAFGQPQTLGARPDSAPWREMVSRAHSSPVQACRFPTTLIAETLGMEPVSPYSHPYSGLRKAGLIQKGN